MLIELHTRDGGFVHQAEIPAFEPPPEVVSWGTRIFVHQATPREPGTFEPPALVRHRYIEGLLWPLVEIPVDARRV